MAKELLIIKSETLGESLLKDSYSLLTNLLLLYVAIHFDNTGWTIVAGLIIFIFAIGKLTSKKHLITAYNPHQALHAVFKYYKMDAEIITGKRKDEPSK